MAFDHLLQDKEFWERVLGASTCLLALDYDGTLAPFHVDRMRALPLAGVMDHSQTIAGQPGTEVAIISGRPIFELLTLLGDPEIQLVGSHGWEERSAEGALVRHKPSPRQLEALEEAYTTASGFGFEKNLEQKIASLALHTRALPKKEASQITQKVHRVWSTIAGNCGMQCRFFNGGVELRATGRDKATALKTILDRLPEGTFPVYVGDDDTDEDAFELVASIGKGIKVGDAKAPTAATDFLPDPCAVADFLSEWIRQAEEKKSNQEVS